ncbi:MAG TPA: DUF2115 domain-containing protein [Methanoregulaceae archaeon]|nr:DUF2115 domain-containing protein [Methanoregulaceae archaeon]
MDAELIGKNCSRLGSQKTRGELGSAISAIVFSYSPRDLQQMRWNFTGAIQDTSPTYRKRLEETITGHLHGTWQTIRLMNQQGSFAHMNDPPSPQAGDYWTMVAAQCSAGDAESVRLRFLKFLLAGFCMFVQGLPGHPAGMPFPGGDKVEIIDGVYYCPVREKANDVDSALCPFCPALQTPEIGYLKPPVDGSRHRKQEFIRQTYDRHHFNG